MLIQSGAPTVIYPVEVWSSLTEVHLYHCHTLLEQSLQLSLIPVHGLRIGEIEHCILIRQSAASILHRHIVLHEILEVTVLRGEVRQLPQTSMETVLLQVAQHLLRILEVMAELVVTLPVGLKPSCVKVYYVTWYLIVTQTLCHVASLLLRKV